MEGAGGSDTSSSCSSSSSSSSCCSTGGLAEGEAISPSAAAAGRGDATQLSPWLASPLSLYLIRLRLLREAHFTLSPKELLTLFQLAGARRAASLKPLETVSPLFVPTETLALPQPPTGERGGGGPGGPTTQLDAKRLQRRSRGQQSFRVDPLDVSLLLVSGELSWSDLPLLEDLEETAAAAEAALQQRERRWWGGWWPSLLLGSRRRGDIWREAAARLQGRGRPCAAAPSPLSLGLKKKASTSHEVEAGPPPSSLLPNAASVGTADLLGLNEETAVGAFAVPSLTAAASSRGNRLNQRPSSAPTPVPAAAAAAAERGLVGSRSPGGDSSGHLRYGPSAWSRPLEETGGEGGEVAFKAAAATVSRMGNEALALLPHGCQWPWAANSRAPAAAVSGLSSASVTSSSCLFQGAPQHPTVPGWGPAEGPLGGLSAASGCGGGGGPLAAGPLAQADTWRASVGLRLRRESRPGGRRRREARGLRQKLSPLDPPYDAYSLYLHPFSCVGAGELPDAEASRAAEVNEVCLDFLGRSRGADSCSSCGQLFAVSGDTAKDRGKEAHKRRPCCLSHHCLHYTKVGDGREKVVLIHGICMSGYFFADLIRFLVPDSPSQGGDDPHESWRFTVYCVDLLGYGKSSSVPSSHSYSRLGRSTAAAPQAEAILRDVILANGFTSVHLVGHSFGGLVAAELCEMLPPGFVTTLILLAPAYFESERQAVRILTALHFPASHHFYVWLRHAADVGASSLRDSPDPPPGIHPACKSDFFAISLSPAAAALPMLHVSCCCCLAHASLRTHKSSSPRPPLMLPC
ncbi:hypothetical protein Esti_006407 [Eimeria stiedai]